MARYALNAADQFPVGDSALATSYGARTARDTFIPPLDGAIAARIAAADVEPTQTEGGTVTVTPPQLKVPLQAQEGAQGGETPGTLTQQPPPGGETVAVSEGAKPVAEHGALTVTGGHVTISEADVGARVIEGGVVRAATGRLYYDGPPDARITIFDWSFRAVRVLDASRIAKSIVYRNTPAGCDQATVTLSCRAEDLERLYPWWLGRSGVEISTADDILQADYDGRGNKIYVGDVRAYQTSNGEDTPQIYLDDGLTVTYRIPVLATGHDTGGDFLIIADPLAGGGNLTQIPPYPAGTVVGRRVWCGRVGRRDKQYTNLPTQTIPLFGIVKSLDGIVSSVTVTPSSAGATLDVGECVFNQFMLEAARLPEMRIDPSNFPTVGSGYVGQQQNATLSTIVTQMLNAITMDRWVLRVGHDRTPRLLKLFSNSGLRSLGATQSFRPATDDYTFTVPFDQRYLFFNADDLQISDEDMSAFSNAVLILGGSMTAATDAQTGQPSAGTPQAEAMVLDVLSIEEWGQVDAAPVSNSALVSDSACAQAGATYVDRFGAPVTTSQFSFRTRHLATRKAALYSPIGLPSGNPLSGTQAIVLRGLNATGSTRNAVADSELTWAGAVAGIDALWSIFGAMVVGSTPDGSQGFQLFGNGASLGAQHAVGQPVNVVPGRFYTLSGFIDARQVTIGDPAWALYSPDLQTLVGLCPGSRGQMGRWEQTIGIPLDYSWDAVVPVVLADNVTLPPGGVLQFWKPQLELGNAAGPYMPNDSGPNLVGLPAYVEETIAAAGERSTAVQFAAERPDFNAEMARQMTAMFATARANASPGVNLTQYAVSAQAYTGNPIPFTVNGLTITTPVFTALFAPGTAPELVGGTSFTVLPFALNRVWLQPDGTWIVLQSSTRVPGAIMYALVQTNATTVVGVTKTAPIGVPMVGFGNINFGNHAAPLVSASALSPGYSDSTVHAQVNATVTVTNCSSDPNISGLAFYYLIHGDPLGRVDLHPVGERMLAQNTPVQTVSFDFEIGAGQAIDVFVGFTGIASSDYGPVTQLGSTTQVANGFTPAAILVTVPYLARGAAVPAPLTQNVSFTPVNSANGISAGMTIRFAIGNQGTITDGSLYGIAIYNKITGIATNYLRYAVIPAQVNAAYVVAALDLTNGQGYDWQIRFVALNGAESPAANLGSSPIASVNVGTSYLDPYAQLAADAIIQWSPNLLVNPGFENAAASTKPMDGHQFGPIPEVCTGWMTYYECSFAGNGTTQQNGVGGWNAFVASDLPFSGSRELIQRFYNPGVAVPSGNQSLCYTMTSAPIACAVGDIFNLTAEFRADAGVAHPANPFTLGRLAVHYLGADGHIYPEVIVWDQYAIVGAYGQLGGQFTVAGTIPGTNVRPVGIYVALTSYFVNTSGATYSVPQNTIFADNRWDNIQLIRATNFSLGEVSGALPWNNNNPGTNLGIGPSGQLSAAGFQTNYVGAQAVNGSVELVFPALNVPAGGTWVVLAWWQISSASNCAISLINNGGYPILSGGSVFPDATGYLPGATLIASAVVPGGASVQFAGYAAAQGGSGLIGDGVFIAQAFRTGP